MARGPFPAALMDLSPTPTRYRQIGGHTDDVPFAASVAGPYNRPQIVRRADFFRTSPAEMFPYAYFTTFRPLC